jgi:hypothetical protein
MRSRWCGSGNGPRSAQSDPLEESENGVCPENLGTKRKADRHNIKADNLL